MESRDMECTSLLVIPQPYSRLRNLIKSIRKNTYLGIKRTFDIICSIIGLVSLIPIMVIVKLSYIITGDFEPIIFVQKRIGLNGKRFIFYKFRTMVPNADRVLKEILKKDKKAAKHYAENKKLKDDPRITKMGKFLRKSSLDELPQMICILKGDMSIIGNRPYLFREKIDMGDDYNTIVSTKPGLTGWWQVSGRSKTTFAQRLRLERYYSEHQSIKLDLKIFFLTFSVVLFGKGAN